VITSTTGYPVLSDRSLTDRSLKNLLEEHQLRIEPYDPDSLNPTSIDLKLGSILVRYKSSQILRLDSTNFYPEIEKIDITNSTYILRPGEFILGMTKERVFIPNGYQGFIETKGNIARAGIQVHNGDGHIDPGFCGHITLEISNMHHNDISIQIAPDIYICQLFISQLDGDCESPYNGKYQGQTEPTAYHP
jgi:dCTP deaminase